MISIFGTSLNFLSLLFCLIGLSIIAFAKINNTRNRLVYIKAGTNAILSSCIIIIICFLALLIEFLSDSFDLKFVANTSSTSTPLIYKIGALWAGSAGSLLLWNTIVSIYFMYFILKFKTRLQEIYPTTILIMGFIYACFVGFLYFLQNPFEPVFGIVDGRGTGPNLQHILMLIHPPLLYTGYIGFLIPFSMTLAALIEGKDKKDYVSINRSHVLFAWLVLTVAIILGGRWAYLELGWGGYWAWDPVENASLMPWLVSTAYLHSILVEQRRGMLKLWNVILVSIIYCLTILGVYLVRGGLIKESVHSFAESEIGGWFLALFFVLFVFSFLTILIRFKSLKPREKIESFSSRESGFLYNNVLFVGIMIFILFAIFQPIFSSIIFDRNIKLVNQSGYNQIAALFGYFLLALMGVAPFLGWKKTNRSELKRIFKVPIALSLFTGLTSVLFFWIFSHLSLMNFSVCVYVSLITFVSYGIFDEFIRVIYKRVKKRNENPLIAFWSIIKTNQSRYGGYIVHLGFLMMIIGFIGRGYESKADYEINAKSSEDLIIDDYTVVSFNNFIEKSDIPNDHLIDELMSRNEIPAALRSEYEQSVLEIINRVDSGRTNHFAEIAEIRFNYKGEIINLPVEKRFYYSPNEITKEIALDSNIIKDLYIILNRVDYLSNSIQITVWINYLVNWVWIGAVIILIGGIVSLYPFASYGGKLSRNYD